jgi:hypothetical protein
LPPLRPGNHAELQPDGRNGPGRDAGLSDSTPSDSWEVLKPAPVAAVVTDLLECGDGHVGAVVDVSDVPLMQQGIPPVQALRDTGGSRVIVRAYFG